MMTEGEMVEAALAGEERRIALELIEASAAAGIVWLAAGDRLVSACIGGAISREALDEEAYLLVDTLRHKHAMMETPAFPEIDVDESVVFMPGVSASQRKIVAAYDGRNCIGGCLIFSDRPVTVAPDLMDQATRAFTVAYKLRRQQRLLDVTSDRLAEISEVGRIFAEVGSPQRTLSTILELAIRSSSAEVGAILHRDKEGREVATGMDLEILRSIVFRNGDNLVARALTSDAESVYTEERLGQEINPATARLVLDTLAVFPLVYESRRYGAMVLLNQPGDLLRDEGYIAALGTIARLAAAALTSEERHSERLEQELTRQELRAAHAIQQSLLPREIPVIGGLRMAGRSQPSREVGGDFYDIFPLGESMLGVMIGDVSGKGIPAGLLMAITRSYLRVIAASHLDSPAGALAHLNRLLAAEIADNRFVTANYIIIDVAKKSACLSNAGHHAPIVIAADGSLSSVDAAGLPLGIIADAEFENVPFAFDAGMTLVLYTDGLIELKNAAHELMGVKRLREILRGKQALASEELLDLMWNRTLAFSASHEFDDDWTSVVVKHGSG